jgi:hypothetical protein
MASLVHHLNDEPSGSEWTAKTIGMDGEDE